MTTSDNANKPNKWIVPIITLIIIIGIIAAIILPGDISNYGFGPAHKNGNYQYNRSQR